MHAENSLAHGTGEARAGERANQSTERAFDRDLSAQQSDDEFNRTLGTAIDEIYAASTTKSFA